MPCGTLKVVIFKGSQSSRNFARPVTVKPRMLRAVCSLGQERTQERDVLQCPGGPTNPSVAALGNVAQEGKKKNKQNKKKAA